MLSSFFGGMAERVDQRIDPELVDMAVAWGAIPSRSRRRELPDSLPVVSSGSSDQGKICYDLGSKDPPPVRIRDRRLYEKPSKPLERWTRDDMFHRRT